MNNYTAIELSQIVDGKLYGNRYNSFSRLLIDSRNVLFPIDSAFFAIVGDRNNGHDYVLELIKKGVKVFVVSVLPQINDDNLSFVLVENTLIALQKLSSYHRLKFNYPVIGVTGSNGKTVVKEWLYQILESDKSIVRSPKSYNSQVGVPLSVWLMKDNFDLGIFEAGISEVGEMEKLSSIINPTIGVFTNIGTAHQENFADIKTKISEKLKLFKNSKILVSGIDNDTLSQLVSVFCLENKICNFTWSFKNKADLQILQVDKKANSTILKALYKEIVYDLRVPFTDEGSVENCITCWSVLLVLNYDFDFIQKHFQKLSPVAMRLELVEGINNCSIINDSYSSDISSLKIALNFLNLQNQHHKRVLILSDILQSGYSDDQLYSEISEIVNQHKLDLLIGIGNNLLKYEGKFLINKKMFSSVDDFFLEMPNLKLKNCTILLKGARKFEFEKITNRLQQKDHETVLEINTNAIVHNLNAYKSLVNPNTKIMAMVKAFSYGSGLFEISNVLQFENVYYLAVAYADEGIELRQAGISLPIMVMSPEPGSFEKMLEFDLEPEIYNFRILKILQNEILKSDKTKVNVHLKLDTGMHRLGFEEQDLDNLILALNENRNIVVKSIFTHLTSAEDVNHDNYTLKQIEKFEKLSAKIENKIGYNTIKHVLNSSGVERFAHCSFDMVRLGIGLYGFANEKNFASKLKPVLSLKTVISQLKHVKETETVGYNKKGVLKKDSVIATIPIGYADGLDRRLGNGIGEFKINGEKVSVVGNICMDMCMLDVTGIKAQEGDEVIVFENINDVLKMARSINTIPYEILTSISRRVKRVYYHE